MTDYARSMKKSIGDAEVGLTFSVAIICMKPPSLSIGEWVSGSNCLGGVEPELYFYLTLCALDPSVVKSLIN